jgi:hypothetical protein
MALSFWKDWYMSFALGRNIVAAINPVVAGPRLTGVAGGAGDNTLTHGTAIDVTALTTPGGSALTPAIEGNARYESVAFLLAVTTTLGATNTLTLTASIETSATSNFSTPITLVATTTFPLITGPSGGATLEGVFKLGCSLEYALQYVRVSFTGDLSAGSVDTSDIAPLAIFGGPGEYP